MTDPERIETRTSGKALWDLICGIGFPCLFPGILAIVLGILGLRDISASRGRLTGSGLAIAGIVLGALGFLCIPVNMALILPAIQRVRMAANDITTQNNLKQIGIAIHNYHDEHSAMPPQAVCDKDGKPLLSWRVLLLPYMEQEALYRQFKLEPWDSPTNKPLSAGIPNTYRDRACRCPV